MVSARRGKVASDAMEERDICRGWKLLGAVEGPRGPPGASVACLDGRGYPPKENIKVRAGENIVLCFHIPLA